MTRPWTLPLFGLACVLLLLGCPAREDVPTEGTPNEADVPEVEAPPLQVELYFPGNGRRLYAETREIPRFETPDAQAAEIVRTLLAGPESSVLHPPLPPQTQVAGTFLEAEARRLILDLRDPDGAPPPPSGSNRELLVVYSIVNSVLLNVEELDQIVLLWNGRQSRSFSGHVDTTHALVADPAWIHRDEPTTE